MSEIPTTVAVPLDMAGAWLAWTGRRPRVPNRIECTHSLDPKYAEAFHRKRTAEGLVLRPNLLSGIWHSDLLRVCPEQWLKPTIFPRDA